MKIFEHFIEMKTTFGNRVGAVLKSKGLKNSEFCRMTGFSRVTLANIINNKTLLPSISILQTIGEHFPEVDMNWVMKGTGEMYLPAANVLKEIGEEDKDKFNPETKEAMEKLISTQEKLMAMMERDIERMKKEK